MTGIWQLIQREREQTIEECARIAESFNVESYRERNDDGVSLSIMLAVRYEIAARLRAHVKKEEI